MWPPPAARARGAAAAPPSLRLRRLNSRQQGPPTARSLLARQARVVVRRALLALMMKPSPRPGSSPIVLFVSPFFLLLLVTTTMVATTIANEEVRSEMRWTQAKLKDDLTTTASGLKYLDMKVGKGPIVETGDTAKVMYKLYGADSGGGKYGRHIYSQSSPTSAFDLKAGAGSVIKGFDEAVLGMRVGGRRYAVLPADIACASAAAQYPPAVQCTCTACCACLTASFCLHA